MTSAYEDFLEEVVRLALEVPEAEYFVINTNDAIELGLQPIMDDATGTYCFNVEGFKIFPSEECPSGTVGACVAESTKVNVGFVGEC